MGLGEGAQAYGWGWYSAESKKLQNFMRDFPAVLTGNWILHILLAARILLKMGLIPQLVFGKPIRILLTRNKCGNIEVKGESLYELDIPKDVIPKLLDWDIELSEQTPFVQKALQDYKDDGASSSATGEFIYKELQKPFLSDVFGYELEVILKNPYLNTLIHSVYRVFVTLMGIAGVLSMVIQLTTMSFGPGCS